MTALPEEKRRGIAALIAVISTWSLIPVVLKYFTYIDVWTVTGFRFLVATLFLLPFLLTDVVKGRVDPRLWRQARWPALINLGGQVCWSIAPYYNQAAVLMFLGRCTFIFSIVFTLAMLPDQRGVARSPFFLAGAVLTIIGLSLMFVGSQQKETSLVGMLIMLGTAACWGMYGVAVRKWLQPFPPMQCFAVVCLYTSPVYILILFGLGHPAALVEMPFSQVFYLAMSAVLAIGLGHSFSYRVFQTFGPVLTEGCYQVIPFLAAVAAWGFLGEQLGLLQWSGGLGIVLGSLLLFLLMLRPGRPDRVS